MPPRLSTAGAEIGLPLIPSAVLEAGVESLLVYSPADFRERSGWGSNKAEG